MKKVMAFILSMLLLLSLVGCGTKVDNENTEPISQNNEALENVEANVITTEPIETTQANKNQIKSSAEYLEAMSIPYEDTIQKDASMIYAKDGIGFHYQGLSFEIYRFSSKNAELIKDAEDGSITFTLKGMESFGPNTSDAVANREYLMIFDTANADVINAFENVAV